MDYYDSNDSYNRNSETGAPYGRPQENPNQVNGMAVASMLCGITGLLFLCCCIAFPASILLGVAAISLAIMSKKGQPFSGYAIAGLVFGIVALLLGIAECAYLILASTLVRDPQFAPVFDEVMRQYEALMQH